MDSMTIDSMKQRFEAGLKRAREAGASGAKFGFSRSESISASMVNNRLKSAGTTRGSSYGINVIVDRKMGSVRGNDLGDFEHLLDRAIEMARFGSAVHFDAYPAPGEYATPKTYCPKAAALTRDEIIAAIRTIHEGLRAHDENLLIESGGSRSIGESVMMTSGGVVHENKTTGWGFHGGGQQTHGTDILHFGAGRGWKQLNDMWDTQYVIDRCIRDLTMSEEIVKAPSGTMKAFLDPGILSMFLTPVRDGINGRTVAMGGSPLAEKIGQQILDPCITILDDPHQDFGSAVCMDGEGIPTQKRTIVDAGVLQTFLYDYDTACMVGAEPTAGGSIIDQVILPGQRTHEEMLASIDEGIYIRGMLGFGQGNIINGDFSGNISPGFLIRDGKIVGRIKDTMIAGNLYDLLGSNVELSSDYDHPGRLPWATVEGVSVSSAE
jgi:PmbA protein